MTTPLDDDAAPDGAASAACGSAPAGPGPCLCDRLQGLGADGPVTDAVLAEWLDRIIDEATTVREVIETRMGTTLQGAMAQLTERERQIFRYLRGTLQIAEIAQRLWLSPNTVKTHAYHIYTKLGVHSRAELRTLARHRRFEQP